MIMYSSIYLNLYTVLYNYYIQANQIYIRVLSDAHFPQKDTSIHKPAGSLQLVSSPDATITRSLRMCANCSFLFIRWILLKPIYYKNDKNVIHGNFLIPCWICPNTGYNYFRYKIRIWSRSSNGWDYTGRWGPHSRLLSIVACTHLREREAARELW